MGVVDAHILCVRGQPLVIHTVIILAKFRVMMIKGKYGDVIGWKTHVTLCMSSV